MNPRMVHGFRSTGLEDFWDYFHSHERIEFLDVALDLRKFRLPKARSGLERRGTTARRRVVGRKKRGRPLKHAPTSLPLS